LLLLSNALQQGQKYRAGYGRQDRLAVAAAAAPDDKREASARRLAAVVGQTGEKN
jgi:hypothetical protein